MVWAKRLSCSSGVIPALPAAIGLQGTPAGIKFESETSFYAGGGLTIQFAPGPVVVR